MKKYVFITLILFLCFLAVLFVLLKSQKNNLRIFQKSFGEKTLSNGILVSTITYLPSHNNVWKFQPRVKGKFYMEFIAVSDKKITGSLTIYRMKKRTGRERYLVLKTPFIPKRFVVPMDISKDDVLVLKFAKEAKVVISIPSFYRKRSKSSLVFIVVADTLRRDRLGVYNSAMKCSPNIDKFARDSVVFLNAYATAPWTLPSHVSLFTGLSSITHGVNRMDEKIPPGVLNLFNFFRSRFLIYSRNGDFFLSHEYGYYTGFDLYQEYKLDPGDPHAAKDLFFWAKKFLKKTPAPEMIFFLHTYQLHSPYDPEVHLAKEYYKIKGLSDLNRFYFGITKITEEQAHLQADFSESEKREIITIYEANVYTFDHYFGEFIKFLKRSGLYDNSMIILVADHGEEFEDHGAWGHGHSLYKEVLNIPLIIKFPGEKYAGKRVKKLVSIEDVLPTVIDYYHVRVKLPYKLEGKSLIKAMGGKTIHPYLISYLAPEAVVKGVGMKISIITDKYELIENIDLKGRENFELYNIQDDPQEKNNIFLRMKHSPEVKHLMNILKKVSPHQGAKRKLTKKFLEKVRSLGYTH